MTDYPHWTEEEVEFDPVVMAEDIALADRVLDTFYSELSSGRLPDWQDITSELRQAVFLLHACSDRSWEWLFEQDIWKELRSSDGAPIYYSKLLPLIPSFRLLVQASIGGRISRESRERTPAPADDGDVLF